MEMVVPRVPMEFSDEANELCDAPLRLGFPDVAGTPTNWSPGRDGGGGGDGEMTAAECAAFAASVLDGTSDGGPTSIFGWVLENYCLVDLDRVGTCCLVTEPFGLDIDTPVRGDDTTVGWRNNDGSHWVTCDPTPPVQRGWDNHFSAFGGQDLDAILLDCSETSRLNIYDFGSGHNRTFYGLAEIRGAFAELFTYLGNNSQNGLAAPVIDVDEERGSVFLVWEAPAAGVGHATDTFDFVGATIAVQTFTIFPADGATPVLTPASSGSLIAGSGEGPACDRFMHHFAAFGDRDLVANAEDYAEDCVVNVHDLRTGVTTTHHGHDGLTQAFTPLYDLDQSLGLAAPLIRVDEPMNGAHGSVFLQLTWPGVADMWTDTFLAGADGKHHTQNVVYRSDPAGDLSGCADRNATCIHWANLGFCLSDLHNDYMHTECPVSCHMCPENIGTPPLNTGPQTTATTVAPTTTQPATTEPLGDVCHFTEYGRPGRCTSEALACAAPDELHEVRCCSDTEITGWKAPANACSVWGESDDTSEGWSCTSNALFSEAQDVCASVGARLCTRQELRDSCATATGCGHDRDMLWTSDEGVAGAVMWAFDLGVGTTSE